MRWRLPCPRSFGDITVAFTSRAALQEPTIAQHPEPFVRSAALVATAELLRAIPPPLLAGAMLRSDVAPSEALFAGRLQQLQDRLQAEYRECDNADMRKTLVGGCLALQAELAEQAMAALEDREAVGNELHLGIEGRQTGAILLPPW